MLQRRLLLLLLLITIIIIIIIIVFWNWRLQVDIFAWRMHFVVLWFTSNKVLLKKTLLWLTSRHEYFRAQQRHLWARCCLEGSGELWVSWRSSLTAAKSAVVANFGLTSLSTFTFLEVVEKRFTRALFFYVLEHLGETTDLKASRHSFSYF